MVSTIIATIVIVALVGAALRYLIVHKRRGEACIGCAVEGICPMGQVFAKHGQEVPAANNVLAEDRPRLPLFVVPSEPKTTD